MKLKAKKKLLLILKKRETDRDWETYEIDPSG